MVLETKTASIKDIFSSSSTNESLGGGDFGFDRANAVDLLACASANGSFPVSIFDDSDTITLYDDNNETRLRVYGRVDSLDQLNILSEDGLNIIIGALDPIQSDSFNDTVLSGISEVSEEIRSITGQSVFIDIDGNLYTGTTNGSSNVDVTSQITVGRDGLPNFILQGDDGYVIPSDGTSEGTRGCNDVEVT